MLKNNKNGRPCRRKGPAGDPAHAPCDEATSPHCTLFVSEEWLCILLPLARSGQPDGMPQSTSSHTRVTFVTPPARILVSILDPTDEMVWERDFQNSSPSRKAGVSDSDWSSSVVVMNKWSI